MKIVRHIKVMGSYNPFHPDWVAYEEKLRVQKMGQTIWSTGDLNPANWSRGMQPVEAS